MRSFPGKLFAKASTHGKRISVLSLITMIVFVLWGQKTFQSQGIIVPASAFTCPFFFLNSPGSSSCPKITIVPPFLKSSTTTLGDQNASEEEAQGINGKTPAKHSAASPKPQGMLIRIYFLTDWVLCVYQKKWPLRKSGRNWVHLFFSGETLVCEPSQTEYSICSAPKTTHIFLYRGSFHIAEIAYMTPLKRTMVSSCVMLDLVQGLTYFLCNKCITNECVWK